MVNAALIALALTAPGFSSSVAGAAGPGSELVEEGMTSKEMLDYSRSANAEIASAVKSTEKALETANRGGDAGDIDCVKKRLASIQALQGVSKRATDELTKELAGAGKQAGHYVGRVAVALSRVRQYASEAQACSGDQNAVEGTTDIQVNADAIAEGDDTTPMLGSDALVGEVNPPQGSPFQ
jgi:hypothetical protein